MYNAEKMEWGQKEYIGATKTFFGGGEGGEIR